MITRPDQQQGGPNWLFIILGAIGAAFLVATLVNVQSAAPDKKSGPADAAVARSAARQAAADDAHTKRQQILDDFGAAWALYETVNMADAAQKDATAGSSTEAYSQYGNCVDKAKELEALPGELPDYVSQYDQSATADIAPGMVAVQISEMCESGRTAVNDPSPEHDSDYQKTLQKAEVVFTAMFLGYEHAYVANGGKVSDFDERFPMLKGGN